MKVRPRLLVACMLLTASCAAPPVSTPTPMREVEVGPTAPATPTPPPVEPASVSGTGTQQTEPFDLPAGSFTVTMTGLADGDARAQLFPGGGNIVLSGTFLFIRTAHGAYNYETQVHGLDAGSYFSTPAATGPAELPAAVLRQV